MQFENASPTLSVIGKLDRLAVDVKKLLKRLAKQFSLLTILSAGVRREPCHHAMFSRKLKKQLPLLAGLTTS
jgi:hypothetical protein